MILQKIKDIKDELNTKLSLQVEKAPSSDDTAIMRPSEKSSNEEEIQKKSENHSNAEATNNGLEEKKKTNPDQDEEKTRTSFSLFLMISVMVSLIFGWVAGFLSLHHQIILTFALISMSIGFIVGFYFDQKISKTAKK